MSLSVTRLLLLLNPLASYFLRISSFILNKIPWEQIIPACPLSFIFENICYIKAKSALSFLGHNNIKAALKIKAEPNYDNPTSCLQMDGNPDLVNANFMSDEKVDWKQEGESLKVF